MDNSELRRRKLDELFADEPHLSTTMKARRLSEKLRDADGSGMTQGFVVTRHLGQRDGANSREALTLDEARELLQGNRDLPGVQSGLAARIGTFRATTLAKWLDGFSTGFQP